MNAEAMKFDRTFDLLWSVESISHYQDRATFFSSAAKVLKPGGTFAITDWFKKENLTPAANRSLIAPIEEGMFVELETMDDYQRYFASNNRRIVHRENLGKNCAKPGTSLSKSSGTKTAEPWPRNTAPISSPT